MSTQPQASVASAFPNLSALQAETIRRDASPAISIELGSTNFARVDNVGQPNDVETPDAPLVIRDVSTSEPAFSLLSLRLVHFLGLSATITFYSLFVAAFAEVAKAYPANIETPQGGIKSPFGGGGLDFSSVLFGFLGFELVLQTAHACYSTFVKASSAQLGKSLNKQCAYMYMPQLAVAFVYCGSALLALLTTAEYLKNELDTNELNDFYNGAYSKLIIFCVLTMATVALRSISILYYLWLFERKS